MGPPQKIQKINKKIQKNIVTLIASPPTGGTKLRRCLDTALPTTLQKHEGNITVYLHFLNRLKGKDAAVLGKQVLKFYEKKI